MGKIKSTKAVPSLIEMLKDKSPEVRWAVVNTLGEIKSTEAVRPLIEMLEDNDSNVRLNTIWALGEIKSTEAVRPLIEMLKDNDSDVRLNAILALGVIKFPDEAKFMIEMSRYKSPKIHNTVHVPEKIKSSEEVRLLIEMLKYDNLGVCSAVIFTHRETKSTEAVPALIKMLKNNASWIRFTVAFALEEIKSPKAVQLLIEMLKDKDSGVRYITVSALSETKSPEAVLPLIEMLKDNDSDVRYAASDALIEINSPKAIQPLIEMLKDKNNNENKFLENTKSGALLCGQRLPSPEFMKIIEEQEKRLGIDSEKVNLSPFKLFVNNRAKTMPIPSLCDCPAYLLIWSTTDNIMAIVYNQKPYYMFGSDSEIKVIQCLINKKNNTKNGVATIDELLESVELSDSNYQTIYNIMSSIRKKLTTCCDSVITGADIISTRRKEQKYHITTHKKNIIIYDD